MVLGHWVTILTKQHPIQAIPTLGRTSPRLSLYSSCAAKVKVSMSWIDYCCQVSVVLYFEIDFHPEIWMSESPGGRSSHCGVLRVGVLFVLSPLAFVCRVLSKDLEERADSLPRRPNITHAAPRGIDPVPSGMRRCLASQNPTVACLRAAPRRVHCFISTSSSRTWWEVGRF